MGNCCFIDDSISEPFAAKLFRKRTAEEQETEASFRENENKMRPEEIEMHVKEMQERLTEEFTKKLNEIGRASCRERV